MDCGTCQTTALIFFICALFNVKTVCCTPEDEHEGFCERINGEVVCDNIDSISLTRLDGGGVNSTREIEVDGGHILKMKTLNTKPLVFEVEDFLTGEECDHFISVAKDLGLVHSVTAAETKMGQFKLLDMDSDKKLSLQEMYQTIANYFDTFLDEEDLLEMYKFFSLDTNGDTFISREEISQLKPKMLKEYMVDILKKHPEKHSRYSRQAWLFPDSSTDEVFERLQQRVSTVVQLPLSLIKLSDFQVVNYGVKGHYNAHIDSMAVDAALPCCDRNKKGRCRICRYMTVLFYLNDVKGGGETAFPLANNETFDEKTFRLEDKQNLYKRCEQASLRVQARKGKAIIWYNHFIDTETGWMGEVDKFTMHGSCPITEGEKWIANFWIKTTNDREEDIKRMKKMYGKI